MQPKFCLFDINEFFDEAFCDKILHLSIANPSINFFLGNLKLDGMTFEFSHVELMDWKPILTTMYSNDLNKVKNKT